MNKRSKLFIFGIGDPKRIEPFIKRYKQQGFDVIVGPTSEDNDFLIKKSIYYKNSFENKIWAFCSDVGRVYKLSKESGLYIDATFEPGDGFGEYFDEVVSKSKMFFFKQNPTRLNNGMLGSSIENNSFFKDVFDKYCDKGMDKFPKLHNNGPDLMSKMVHEHFGVKLDNPDQEISNDFFIEKLSNLRKKEIMFGSSNGTGFIRPPKVGQTQKLGDDGTSDSKENQINKNDIKMRDKLFARDYNGLNFYRIKEMYEYTTDRKTKKYLRKVYSEEKQKGHNPKFDERLILSILHDIFTLKIFKNNPAK